MTKTRQVAIILKLSQAYHRQILIGVGSYAAQAGNWRLYVENESTELLPNMKNWHGDGIILSFFDRRLGRAVSKLPLAVVGIEGQSAGYPEGCNIPYFATDNREIGRLGADHLIEQGFLRLAFCGYPHVPRMSWAAARRQGFVERARERGIPCSIWSGRFTSARQWADLQKHLTAWLDSLEKPVGVMAAFDTRARHVLEACRTIGARVPEDIAVLGVDNDEVQCELTTPPLSSIEHGSRNLGYHTAALLDRMMDGERSREIEHLVPPQGIVTRRSTDILAMSDTLVAEALSYIREHACDPIHISDVVDMVHVSRSALLSRFKAVMGRTIHAEIQRVQIARIRTLVATTDLPLKQIATMTGFANVDYMITVFHEYTGSTPGKYRRNAQLCGCPRITCEFL